MVCMTNRRLARRELTVDDRPGQVRVDLADAQRRTKVHLGQSQRSENRQQVAHGRIRVLVATVAGVRRVAREHRRQNRGAEEPVHLGSEERAVVVGPGESPGGVPAAHLVDETRTLEDGPGDEVAETRGEIGVVEDEVHEVLDAVHGHREGHRVPLVPVGGKVPVRHTAGEQELRQGLEPSVDPVEQRFQFPLGARGGRHRTAANRTTRIGSTRSTRRCGASTMAAACASSISVRRSSGPTAS